MAPTIEQLGSKHADALRAFLAREPIQNLYLLGLLEEHGVFPKAGRATFAFWGSHKGPELNAVLFVGGTGGLVVPCANAAVEVGALAEQLSGKVRLLCALGARSSVDGVVRALCTTPPRQSYLQRIYSVSADDLGPFTNPPLRLAREEDLSRVLPLAAGFLRESLKRDPLAEDAEGFKARVLGRIRGKRTYVLESNGRIVFKIDVGSRSQYGAELEGLYTLPEERRRGHAVLSLGQISRHLLSSLPRLTLRADERDTALAQLARKVGYLAGAQQRLVLADVAP
jgi:hypothetical protein